MRLKEFVPFSGPKVFKFKDPDTGHAFSAKSMAELLSQITSYRTANELKPIDYLSDVVENYLCHLPEHAGACRSRPPLKRGLFQTIKGGIALIKSIAYNQIVTQEEADRRSEICSKCPHNVFPDKGEFIKWSDEIAEAAVGKRRSSHHDEIGNCAVCSCPLRAKVWIGQRFSLSPNEIEQMNEVGCWQPLSGLVEIKKK